MSKMSSFVKLVSHPGQRDALLTALREMLPVVADEDGTEVYSFHVDRRDDNTLWLFGMYRDEAALTIHTETEAMKSLLSALMALIAEPPLTAFATPTDAKGLEV